MRNKRKDHVQYSVYEAGEYIQADDGTKYTFAEEAEYSIEKHFFTAVMVNETTKQKEFVKFTYCCEDVEKEIVNLKREGAFQLHYPFIVHVYGNFKGKAVGVMGGESPEERAVFGVRVEYIEGQNLFCHRRDCEDKMKNGELSRKEFEKQTFKQMFMFLYGINYYMNFAREPYLQRDLKPQNLMISEKDLVYIIDFDFAHISGSKDTINLVRGHYLGGSLGYTDPRTINHGVFDRKSEIYAAGKTLFYWLNGKEYYNAEETGSQKIVEKNNPDVYYNNANLAYGNDVNRYALAYQADEYEELRSMIGKMCATPEERYEDVAQILHDLKVFLAKHYGGTRETLEEIIRLKQMPVLQYRDVGRAKIRVAYKKCSPGEGRIISSLYEYTMWDIFADGDRKLMTIYNLNGKVYYIPSMEYKDLKREREGKDYRILDQDLFIVDNIKMQFFIKEDSAYGK